MGLRCSENGLREPLHAELDRPPRSFPDDLVRRVLLQVDQDGERVAGAVLREQCHLDALGGLHLQVAEHLLDLWLDGITVVPEHRVDDLGSQAFEVVDELVEMSRLIVDIIGSVRRHLLLGRRGST